MEYQGRIYKLFPITSGTSQSTGNPWKRQDFIFEYHERPEDTWSQRVVLNIMNDRIKEYNLHENDEVEIAFTHSARIWQDRAYNEIFLRSFRKIKEAPKDDEPQPAAPAPSTPEPEAPVPEKTDDLPF